MPLAPTAEQQARMLDFYYASFSHDVSLMTGLDLANTSVSAQVPLEIADLDGSPLFRDFAIAGADGRRVGVLRSSARGAALPLIDAIMIGQALFDPEVAERDCQARAAAEYPGATVRSRGFVCYGYPRIGVSIDVTRGGQVIRAIYDAHMTALVRELPAGAARPATDAGVRRGEEGEPFYSYSAQLPEAGEVPPFADEWQRAARHMTNVTRVLAHRGVTFRPATAEPPSDRLPPTRAEDALEDFRPAMQGVTLPIGLIGQETPVFCAVATIKMILGYLGFHDPTQAVIAQAVRTGATGTTNDNMIRGLNELTGGKWAATLVDRPTLGDSSQYLGGFVPAKSGIPGHARLLRGYREYVYRDPTTGLPSLRQSFYLVNDPYPTRNGQYAMENAQKPIDDFYRNLLKLQPAT
ncbi:MAG TPA: hypothetical protein VHE61_21705 [Opitutaceae bacterium]|nr:hypothetical protein [Opitutaceae bacterium]